MPTALEALGFCILVAICLYVVTSPYGIFSSSFHTLCINGVPLGFSGRLNVFLVPEKYSFSWVVASFSSLVGVSLVVVVEDRNHTESSPFLQIASAAAELSIQLMKSRLLHSRPARA